MILWHRLREVVRVYNCLDLDKNRSRGKMVVCHERAHRRYEGMDRDPVATSMYEEMDHMGDPRSRWLGGDRLHSHQQEDGNHKISDDHLARSVHCMALLPQHQKNSKCIRARKRVLRLNRDRLR